MGDFLDNHIEDILAGMPSPKETIQQELEEEIKRLSMFRLLSLTILHHRVLGNINLTFSQDENQEHYPEDIYTSVVIGANGIGKSFLLRAIADIFSFLDGQMEERVYKKSPVDYQFSIKYMVGISTYEFTNIDRIEPAGRARRNYMHTLCKRDGEEVRIGQMVVPSRVIASTMTVTDKFTTVNSGHYIYKGIRNENSPSTTGTRTMVRKTVGGLLHSLDVKEGFREELVDLLEHMGLRPRLEVSYTVRYRNTFLRPDMTAEQMCDIFEHQDKSFENRKTQLWGTKNFQKLRADREKLERVVSFMRNLAERNVNVKKVVLTYSLLEDPQRINAERDVIEALSAIDLLTFPSLKVYKGDTNFGFDESSSGETHLLCQLIGIMSDIEHGSLILIDEPENSSHPNWQINYIEWLKNIFNHYCDSHFVIATHSHFILSDLKPESSDIIALDRGEDGIVRDVAENLNTFNWTVDDILYEVFRIRNTKNEALERDLERAIQLMEEKGQAQEGEIETLLTRFNNVYRGDRDPLGKFIEELKKYAESKS